jgi:hypothetical protein
MSKPCVCCGRSDFPSDKARRQHEYRMRKKSENMPTNDKIDQIFESFGTPKYSKMLESMTGKGYEESQKPKSIPREPKTKSNLGQFWREEMERKIEEYKEGKFENVEDCASEYRTILLSEGMEEKLTWRFYEHIKKRLFALNQSQFVAPQPQPQPQPREISITERAELEAAKINAQRGFAIAPRYACEVCHRDGLSFEEAVACEQSHQTVITTQNESEIPREIARPRVSSQSLPQNDAVIRGIKGLLSKFAKSPKQKEEKTEVQEETEEAYSPVTYHNIVTWQAPEPIPIRTCEVCGETVEIEAFRAGHHGKGRCG